MVFLSEKTSTCRIGAMNEYELLDKVRELQDKKWEWRDKIENIIKVSDYHLFINYVHHPLKFDSKV